MKIEILCGSGSPDGVHLSDIQGESGRVGVGGSEYALLTMCEWWAKEGHEVVLYNNPTRQDGIFEQRLVNTFDTTGKRDILIIFREPSAKIVRATGKKIFWSCDQYTTGDFSHFSQFVDQVVTISPFHTKYFKENYGIDATDIDLPVRTWEYDNDFEKVKNRLIFTSVPDRGLDIVAKTFQHIIKRIPDASLVITSDYRLWGSTSPGNAQFVTRFLQSPSVEYLGAVPRKRLLEVQQQAQIQYYQFGGQTEELFCLAVAESQVAGVLPITSSDGALETTNMGVIIEASAKDQRNYPAYIDKVVEYLQKPGLEDYQRELSAKARKRFGISRILKEWDEKVF